MSQHIDFYFEFSSPYAYLASLRIEPLAARYGCTVRWRPYLMGAVMQRTGMRPLLEIPLLGDYARRDLERTARRTGIPLVLPEPFPFSAVAAARAFYWLHDVDPGQAKAYAHLVYAKAFGEGVAVSTPEHVAVLASRAAMREPEAVLAALQDQQLKDRLRRETDAAVERGVFGSPYFIVDGEPFFGNDHMDEMEEWVRSGGW